MRRALAAVSLVGCLPSPASFSLSAPRVAAMAPADGAVDVLPDVTLQICFDGPLQAASVVPANVVLDRMDGHAATPVTLSLGIDGSGTCLSAAPAVALSPASRYQLTLKNKLLGANGIALGDTTSTDAYVASFTTVGPASSAVLALPPDGTLAAPLNLSQVVVTFDPPVALLGDGGPLSILPGGGPSTLSTDGRLAISSFDGAGVGTAVSVDLTQSLLDPSGQVPNSRGPLTFTMGSCPETSAPSIGGMVVTARDVDAWLQFSVDRPSLCGAQVIDPQSPDAGPVRVVAASCDTPYDPCSPGLGCLCLLGIAPLGPGDTIEVVPTALGSNGLIGEGLAVSMQTVPPLPRVVLTEVFAAEKAESFVELQNRTGQPIDLTGAFLADCDLSQGCVSIKGSPVVFGPPNGIGSATVPSNGYALLVDLTFETASAPSDAVLLSPMAGVSMIHLSTTTAQSIGLFLPEQPAVVSMYDGSVLPKAGLSIERIDPGATEVTPGEWAVSIALGGTPGACNSVTPGGDCDPSSP